MFRKYRIPYHLDDPRTTIMHRDLILAKPFLRRVYMDWYAVFKKECERHPGGKFLEIGSGGGFLKQVIPDVITSDILQLPGVDRIFSAEEMPFEDNSLSVIMMLNVFHHIPRPALFLKEAQRTLKNGGVVIMTEPANSSLGRFIYKRFHHEPFDEKGGREIEAGNPLSNSNQALPYIFFERDPAWFAEQFPDLRISSVEYHSPFTYLLSGGVSRSALLPYPLYGLVKFSEWLLSPFSRQLGLFCTIRVEKKDRRAPDIS